MQEAEEAAAEAEAEGLRGFRFPREGRVVELELFQRELELFVIARIGRVKAAEDHRLHFLEAGHGLGAGAFRQRNGVADLGVAQFLDVAAEEAHLARGKLIHVAGLGREHAEPDDFVGLLRGEQLDLVAFAERPVHDAEHDHDALIGVIPRVENECLERRVGVALGRGQALHNGFEHVWHAVAGLGADGQGLGAVQPDVFFNFGLHPLHVGTREVDFVEDRDDLVVVVKSEVDVGERLRLHALRGVHHQQRAFAGGQGARHFVVEVHVSGRVDEVQLIFLSVGSHIRDAHGLRLDGDAALAFQIHLVQVLLAGLALADDLGQLKDAVGKGGLAVVDMGDDAEIANMIQTGHGISCIGLRRLKSILISQNRAKVHAARPCPPGGRGEGACPGNGVVRNRSRTGRSHAGGVTACMRYRGSRPLLPGRAPGPRRTAVPACRRGSRWNRWR